MVESKRKCVCDHDESKHFYLESPLTAPRVRCSSPWCRCKRFVPWRAMACPIPGEFGARAGSVSGRADAGHPRAVTSEHGHKVLLSIYLMPDQHAELRQLSEATRRPVSTYLRDAIDEVLTLYERELNDDE